MRLYIHVVNNSWAKYYHVHGKDGEGIYIMSDWLKGVFPILLCNG